MSNQTKKVQKELLVEVTFEGRLEGQNAPNARVYVFNRRRGLVDSKPVGDKGARFSIDPTQDYRITVGPNHVRDKAPRDIVRSLAKSRSLSQEWLHLKPSNVLHFTVYPPIWRCWFPTCINVHGTVRKHFNTGGYAPLCSGTVQIFQVDLGCTLDSFTVIDLETLKARMIERLTTPVLSIEKAALARPPLPGPGPVESRYLTSGRLTNMAQRGPAPVSANAASASVSISAQRSQVFSPSEAAMTLASLDGTPLKEYIVANSDLFWPIWCGLIPDWAFCWQELTEVPIQSDGTFNAEICFWCPEDYPDLYFEVVQNLGGTDTEVYDPQIACSTYYNYDGSESVDITIEDPRAIACQPVKPGPDYLYVWPTAIGNEDLRFIDGIQTGTGTGLLNDPGYNVNPAPWGGTLSLQMQLDPNLRSNNIMYYRWSYMFDGDPAPTIITQPVTHRWIQVLTGPVIIVNSYNLGPQTKGPNSGLFEIPDPATPWIDIDDPADRPFAYFDSTVGGSVKKGMCTLILEFFDSAGNFVPCANPPGVSTIGDQAGDPALPGPFTFILPKLGGPSNTYVPAPPANITDHGRLIFRIQVDNNPTVSDVSAVKVNGTASDPCGLLYYGNPSDNVEIDYYCYHPENFLDWGLWVYRGVPGVLAASIPPSPPPTSTSSGSPGLPAAFNNSASGLLGSCSQAAFAVNVYCWARATNGYSRQNQYDSQSTGAFVLLKPCPPCPPKLL